MGSEHGNNAGGAPSNIPLEGWGHLAPRATIPDGCMVSHSLVLHCCLWGIRHQA